MAANECGTLSAHVFVPAALILDLQCQVNRVNRTKAGGVTHPALSSPLRNFVLRNRKKLNRGELENQSESEASRKHEIYILHTIFAHAIHV